MLFHDLGNEKIIRPLSLDSRVHFYNFEKLTVNLEVKKLKKGRKKKIYKVTFQYKNYTLSLLCSKMNVEAQFESTHGIPTSTKVNVTDKLSFGQLWSGTTLDGKQTCASTIRSTNDTKGSLRLFLGGFHNESLVDMWDDTTTSDGSLDQSVKLFVASDSQLEMSWCDSLHFKILGGVASKLKDLSREVLEDSSAVNCGSSTNSGVGADSALQESMNSTDWELCIDNK